MFTASLQTVVPASFFVQAAQGPWGIAVSSLWMLASYLIGYVSFVLLTFRVSEILGRLATFWVGILLFIIFSAVGGHATTAYDFSVFRAIQGMGAGIVIAICLLVVAINCSDRSRGLYIAGLCGAQLFGVGAAHTIGGKLAIEDKFRWGIYMAAILMAAPALLCTPALFAGRKQVHRHESSLLKSIMNFDFIGALLLFGAVIMCTCGLTFGGNEHKWGSVIVLCLIIFGVASAVLFIVWEKLFATHPHFNTQWLHMRNLQISVIGILFMSMAFFANSVYVPIMYLTTRHITDTFVAGKKTIPYWALCMGGALITGIALRIRAKFARPMVWAGLLIGTVFSGLYFTIEAEPTSEAKEKAFYAMAGLGIGLAYPAITYMSQVSVSREDIGAAAVIGHFLSIVGGMLGLILYQAALKSQLILRMDTIFKSNPFLAMFNIRTMDIAGLEVSGPSIMVYAKEQAPLIAQRMADALHITFILSVPFLGFAFLATLLYKHNHGSAASV